VSAVLSFSAVTNNDKVGVIFFSDKVEKYIPPKKGRSHILRIIRELIALEPEKKAGTDIKVALEFLNHIQKKKSTAFLLSDFISQPYEQALRLAARKHDLVGIQIYDKHDRELPQAGLVQMMDAESGTLQWVDTDDKMVRNYYANSFDQHKKYCVQAFRKSGAQLMDIRTDADYVKELQTFFKAR
jgi:uncharacterized protein (DUF58 family)